MQCGTIKVVDKMRNYIDEMLDLEEKLNVAAHEESHWRREVTDLRNRLDKVKREAKQYSNSLFSE